MKFWKFPELFLKKYEEFAKSRQPTRRNTNHINVFLVKYNTKIVSKIKISLFLKNYKSYREIFFIRNWPSWQLYLILRRIYKKSIAFLALIYDAAKIVCRQHDLSCQHRSVELMWDVRTRLLHRITRSLRNTDP